MSHQLFYRIEGHGAPVVLLHGFLASSHYFKELRSRLSASHQVISIDLLGFGRSPKPRDGFTYSDHVETVHATLQRLGITKFVLVGHSLGGLVALRYSLTYPNEVNDLLLFNPPMYRNPEQAIATLKATGLHYRIILHSPARDLLWYGAKVLPRFPFNTKRPPINFTDVLRAGKHARRQTYENVILRAEFFTDIEKLRVPCLLVVGKYDRKPYHENSEGWLPPENVAAVGIVSGHHLPIKSPQTALRIIKARHALN